METLLVICNMPDAASAEKISDQLLEKRLAACINQMAPCISRYRWEGKIEQESEIPLLIKTTQTAYPKLQQLILELHPYDVPEIIAIPVTQGLPGYLNWVEQQTSH